MARVRPKQAPGVLGAVDNARPKGRVSHCPSTVEFSRAVLAIGQQDREPDRGFLSLQPPMREGYTRRRTH
jgi:hypothetical protein